MTANPEKLKICYIGGGSRDWAWVLMKDLCFEKEISGVIQLYDINVEAAQANEVMGNKLMAAHSSRWIFKTEPSLEKALERSDFVIISILPGSFENMAIDVHAPEQYGIYQSVGDSIGPGGLNRSLRTVPMYEEIAAAIEKWAPGAWVINYTNPMAVCTRTLYRVFPGIKAFGCCHEVFHTQDLLAKAAEHAGLATGIKREEINTNVVGLNHFTWIDQASWKNIDLFPIYRQFVEEFAEAGYHDSSKEENWQNSYFECGNRVKMDLFRHFGIIAAAGDRHLAEFCPPHWYMKNPDMVKSWQFSLTPVSWRMKEREELKRKSKAFRDGLEVMKVEPSGEEGLRQLKALLGLGNFVTNVNLPNQGQMPGFPAGAVVETNAYISQDSIQPVITKGQPGPLRSLTCQHIENQEGIIDAALRRDFESAFRVFVNDVQIRTINRDDARRLFTYMTEKTLPEGYWTK
ncbi:MAG: alpha-glucosidase/alpha-galactosidase [Treponema sp.]|nr:alpha-glucosidase/alpha-galactosidase [Treponema sp.]